MSLNESMVEDAALDWFEELGYAVGHGPHIAPGEAAAERDSFGEVMLVERLREAIRRLNPRIPEGRARRGLPIADQSQISRIPKALRLARRSATGAFGRETDADGC